ncbi:MAG: hypothetical protein RR877_10090 [Aurantimicrobium sp.]|uniref:hypothetical protein n=1 Tax=Aurantimicrobium sp. TaxID=1930784 RepID=UPI002FC77E6C
MNRDETKNLLPILTAYANGERVQFLSVLNNGWEDIPPGGSSFGLPADKYRIKPPPVAVKHWIIVGRETGNPLSCSGVVHTFPTLAAANHRHGLTLDPEKWAVVEMTGSYDR